MTEEKKFLPEFHIYMPEDLRKRWFIYFRDLRSNKRIRRYGNINSFNTADERHQAAQELIEQLKDQMMPSDMAIQKAIYAILEDKRLTWRKKTYQTMKSKADIFFGWMHRKKITEEAVEEFFKALLLERHPTTHNAYYNKLKHVFELAGFGKLFNRVGKVKAEMTPARYFQSHHIKRLKREINKRDLELWLYVQFIYYCFIRPGDELRKLKAGDILLDEDRIIIKGTQSKNSKTQYVAIPTAFKPSILFTGGMNPGDYLFPSPRDRSKPIGINTMSNRHRVILRELGFDHQYKLYSWKHTGAVALARAGVSLKAIQLQLRHHSLDQTDEYLRQLGVGDFQELKDDFPAI
jgi:integrase